MRVNSPPIAADTVAKSAGVLIRPDKNVAANTKRKTNTAPPKEAKATSLLYGGGFSSSPVGGLGCSSDGLSCRSCSSEVLIVLVLLPCVGPRCLAKNKRAEMIRKETAAPARNPVAPPSPPGDRFVKAIVTPPINTEMARTLDGAVSD